ncbi:MAG: YheU family protein [Polyangiales bacterium]
MNEQDEDPRAPDGEPEEPVEIPLDVLSPAALLGVIDDFVLREGTEYGEHEVSLDRKRAQVHDQLKRGQARLMFDPNTKTCTIVTRDR